MTMEYIHSHLCGVLGNIIEIQYGHYELMLARANRVAETVGNIIELLLS